MENQVYMSGEKPYPPFSITWTVENRSTYHLNLEVVEGDQQWHLL